ncbi:hypothetical protein pdam_00009980 [Pocillopora damicornis]|uniref:DUF5641 domain-containing protein n=1 Tax=Pocillopora damicornis TaxID=46731 RepID=A0A3M6UZK7_POCDA|nr:hypothetical protein pdam_00009980 [Pocillopora damicornis]
MDVQLLTRRRRYLSELLGQFWNRWKREYLVDLREHHRLANEGASVAQSVAPGDIVTEMEEGKSNRSTWKRERIAEKLGVRNKFQQDRRQTLGKGYHRRS